jgi:hypothetical protein
MNELNVFSGGQVQKQGGSLESVTAQMAMTRQAQEVQAAMIVAKRFPRDPAASMERILAACMRPSLAEAAQYEYSRGGSTVTGPSIRLAEAIAQGWGNIDFGYIELEQKNRESQVMAYAWDLETNTRQSKVFSVPHIRHTSKGDYPLTDPRDIYEMVANQAARRVRACILGVIPGDVIESAQRQCDLTLKANNKLPLDERIKEMVARYAELGISTEQLRGFIGKNVEAFTENDVIRLGKIYRSIKDGVVGNEYFIERMKESTAEATEKPQDAPAGNEPPSTQRGQKRAQIGLDDLA